jgi:hypothetical protein
MNVKKIALLFGALMIAVVTAVMAKNMFAGAGAEQAAAAPAVPLGPKVLVARKALPVGTIVDAESLAYQPWPKELIQSAYYTEGSPDSDMSKLLGTVVRNPITAGQPLTHGTLVGPNDRGFLADPNSLVGQVLSFLVTEFAENGKRVVLSRRKLLERHPEFKAQINEPIGPFDSPAITNVSSREMLDALLEAWWTELLRLRVEGERREDAAFP